MRKVRVLLYFGSLNVYLLGLGSGLIIGIIVGLFMVLGFREEKVLL